MTPKAKNRPGATASKPYRDDEEAKAAGSWLFSFFDQDQSGFLHATELERTKQIMLAVAWGQDVSHVVAGVESFDADANGQIDEPEWHTFVQAVYEIVGRKKFLQAVGTLQPVTEEALPAPPRRKSMAKAKHRPSINGPADDDGAATAAALKIQKMQRGKQGRSEAKEKKLAELSSTLHREQEATTIGELWDMVTVYHSISGKIEPRSRIQVQDCVYWFAKCREHCALGLNLQHCASLPEDVGAASPLDLSVLQVDCLVQEIHKGKVDLEEIRHLIMHQSVDCPANNNGSGCEDDIKLVTFRRAIQMISALMRIEQQTLISTMIWHQIQRFELSEVLAANILEKVAHMGERGSIYRQLRYNGESASRADLPPSTDTSVLRLPMRLGDFAKMIYNAGLDDPHEKKGIRVDEIQTFWIGLDSKMPSWLAAHAALGRKVWVPCHRDTTSVCGRTELEVMLKELWMFPVLSAMFLSPMHMVLFMLESVNTSNADIQAKLDSVDAQTRAGSFHG
eukprot:TRINITY_DN47347_c0_g1_i1.p1 TRINITY_DN47347_c0_g1~~TRINITY_DN47347_c0_g1_i1.p1  ORF type:complete len:509 (+),score=83.33 TRINITY_DN47347_c0_g1_i1:48-1574(+)